MARKAAAPGSRRTKGTAKAAAAGIGRELTHEALMQAAVTPDPELQRRSELLWDARSVPGRGPKPSITPDTVVQVAIAIADADGLSAVTMHAVSGQLGVTAMALYRYFPSKDALNDAIVDAGMGLPPTPKGAKVSWREEVTAWAHARRTMFCDRPWLAELPFVAAPHGPNWMSWLEAIARPLSRTGLPPAEVGQMLSIVDGYTRGASDTSISLARARARGISERQWGAAVGADLGRAIGDPRFPAFAAILTAPPETPGRTMEESFDFGLQRVLDGIEKYVKQAKR
jgi:AcrR family transcriptional regulator